MKGEKISQSTSLLFLAAIAVFIIGALVVYSTSRQSGSDELDKVVLQLKWIRQSQFAGYLVAEAKGYYEEEGIDLEVKPGGVGINPVDVLIANDADIAVAWTGNVLPAITKGEDLVNIGQGFQRTGMRMMAFKTSGIETPADIRGKKVGVWPGGNELEPYAFVEKQGLDKDRDVEIIQEGFDMNQLLNGEIDLASAMIYNEYWLPIEAGHDESEFTVFDLEDEGAGMLQDALFVKKSYLNNNKDLLVRFLRASMKGWDYALTHQEEAVDLLGIDFEENDVTAKDHQLLSIQEVSKLMAAEDGQEKGLFYINRDKLDQTVTIAETYVDEVHDINTDEIYTLDIWEEAVKDFDFSDYSSVFE
jgi:NitT/TauT family transport system substrate-binding protein